MGKKKEGGKGKSDKVIKTVKKKKGSFVKFTLTLQEELLAAHRVRVVAEARTVARLTDAAALRRGGRRRADRHWDRP